MKLTISPHLTEQASPIKSRQDLSVNGNGVIRISYQSRQILTVLLMRIHSLRIVNFIVKSLSRRNYLNSQAILVTGPDFSYNQSVTPKNKSFLQCFLRFFRISLYHYILYLDFVKMYLYMFYSLFFL